jgi:iron complex outermembrane receptor protein
VSPGLLLWAALTAGAATEIVVVTPERADLPIEEVPVSTTVLTREDIEALPAVDLGEILAELPGFQVLSARDPGALPMVSSRGFFGGGEAEYVLLLVDGSPVANVESGIVDWRSLRSVEIERIEAMRGAGSSLYGDAALGGVIQVFTRRERADDGPEGTVSASVASFGSFSGDAGYRAPLGRTALGISGTLAHTDGFREHSAETRSGADASLQFPERGKSSWSLSFSADATDREDPGLLRRDEPGLSPEDSDPMFRFDFENGKTGRVKLAYRYQGSSAVCLGNLQLSGRESDGTRTLLIAADLGDRTHREIATRSVDGSFQIGTPAGTRTFDALAAVDVSSERLDLLYRSVSEAGVPEGELAGVDGGRRRLGIVLSGSARASSRVRFTSGVRFDRIEDRVEDDPDLVSSDRSIQEAVSPRVGINVRAGPLDRDPVSFFAQISRAFKAPTLEQLFDPRPFPDFAGGTFRISNPLLSPQRALTVEGGAARSTARATFDATAYRTEVEDEIDFDPATFTYRNIGRTLHTGAEISGSARWDRFTPFVRYAFTRVESLEGESQGRQLKNVPLHSLAAGVNARFDRGVAITIRGSWMEGRYLDDLEQIPAENALVIDVRAQKALSHVRLWLDVLNATDATYEQAGFLLPDFAGGEAAYVLPAAGRTVRLGADWTF